MDLPRLRGSLVAPALCAAVFLAFFLDPCSCQQTFVLEWTSTGNVNYTQFMSTVKFVAGDTLCFNNTDVVDHDVLEVPTQSDFDACNADNSTGWVVNPGLSYNLNFTDPAYRVWIIDTQYCNNSMKVEFPVLNTNGTAVLPDNSTADPPSLNPPVPDPESPPSPPLGVAGSPPSAADSQPKAHWAVLAAIVAACLFRL